MKNVVFSFLVAAVGVVSVRGAAPQSDDFNSSTLNTALWTVVNPVGDGSVKLNGKQALLSVPAGTAHDLWTGGNQSVRILQSMPNQDFSVEVKFDTPLSSTIQDEGIIVAEDANNYVRFDVYRYGSAVNYFSASFVNNVPTTRAGQVINAGNSSIYLRVFRQGNNWAGTWSVDGVSFTAGASFTFAMTVAQIGPFAANNSSGSPAPAFTAAVDYFHNLTPIITAVPDVTPKITHSGNFTQGSAAAFTLTVLNVGTGATSGTVTVQDSIPTSLAVVSVSATSSIWTCQTASQKVTCTSAVAIGAGAVSSPIVINLNVSGAPGSYVNAVTASGGGETNTANNQLSDAVTIAPVVTVTGVVSDDFHATALKTSLWSFVNPLGDAKVSLNGTHALLSVPGGKNHDVWTNGIDAPRILQPVSNTDFDVKVKFDSAVDLPCQLQGLLVLQDTKNFIRFDVYSYGTNAHLFVANFVNGAPAVVLDKVIGDGIPLPFYLRVVRTQNVFSYQTSTDGQNFPEAARFTRALTVSQVGPFAGNNACGYTAPAFTSSIDYFFNTASPILAQDGLTTANPVFNIWYGDSQTFGANGNPQKWVNILGTVLSPNGAVQSLKYSLNGAAAQNLSVGATSTRLNQPGDFNVEIPYTSLRSGANTVALTAIDAANNLSTHSVTVNYVAGKTWPLPYTINWTASTNVQAVAQVVDGKWTVQPDGTVRTDQVGYDRLLAIGDMSAWKNYVVTAEATVHYINDPAIAAPASHVENVFGVGILVGWKGHTADIFGQPVSVQPNVGHPFPAVGWYSDSGNIGPVLGLYQNTPSHQESVMTYVPGSGLALNFETKYVFKMQVTANANQQSSHYSLKVWPAANAEPALWTVQADGDLSQGSVLLAAHRTDVSFGKITVTGLP